MEVTIYLSEAVVETLTHIAKYSEKQWNRDTIPQASASLKHFGFEFLINLMSTQRILAYTTSTTTRLRCKGLDMPKAYEEIGLVIRTLQQM